MQFAYPQIFYMVVLGFIPLALAFIFWINWKRQQALKAFGDPNIIQSLNQHLSPARIKFKQVTWITGLLLLGLALAGPQLGVKMVEIQRQGVDVIIALDVSRSMLAEDIKPNRLQRAQQELTALIDHLKGDRVGIVAFAGSAQVACPLTTDYASAKMFLNYLTPDTVPFPGTALKKAIEKAIATFTQGGAGYRVLILLTDGEDHAAKVTEAAQQAKDAGIKILGIGFGTAAGEPIPLRDAQGKIKEYVKDQNGMTVMSKLDEKTLQKITAITKGTYLQAQAGQLEAEHLAAVINKMQKRDISAGQYGAYENRYQFVLAPAIILLLLSLLLSPRRGVWLGLFLLAGLIPQALWAGVAEDVNKGNRAYKKGKYEQAQKSYQDAQIKRPDEPVVHYNLGNTWHNLKSYAEAQKAYQRALASKNKKHRAQTLYNLGNNYFQQQDYGQAVEKYREALNINPRDEDTIYNLAQALVAKQQPPKPDQNKQNQKSQEKDKKKSDKSKGEKQESKENQSTDKKPGQPDDNNKNGPDDKGEAQAGNDNDSDTQPPEQLPKPKPGSMNPEDAKNLLDAVRDTEREAQRERWKKMKKLPAKRGQADW